MSIKEKLIHLLGGYTEQDVANRYNPKQDWLKIESEALFPESVHEASEKKVIKPDFYISCPHKKVFVNSIYCDLGRLVTRCDSCDCPEKRFIPM